MDLLTGYGSGSESEDEVPQPLSATDKRPGFGPTAAEHVSSAAPRAGGLFGSLPVPKLAAPPVNSTRGTADISSSLPAGFFDSPAGATATAASPAAGLPAGFFDTPANVTAASTPADANAKASPGPAQASPAPPADLPQPSDPELWNKLPAPKTAAGKRKVMFRPQINMQLLAGSDSDEDDAGPTAKKAKAAEGAAGKPSILSFLPAPKNQPAAPKGLSSGTRLQTSAPKSTAAQQQPDAAAAAAAPTAAPSLGNEAYRLGQPAAAAVGHHGQYQSSHQQDYQQYQQQYDANAAATYDYSAYGYSSGYEPSTAAAAAGGAGAAASLPPEEALLQEALQAEAAKAARRAAGGGSAQLVMPDIQFKEVVADKIKYVDPAQREAAQGMRAALGTDYAAKLRAQAAPHQGSKLARSKHQIGTLFANAKLRELEVLENRASGMKSKAETAGKYGWK